MLDALSQSYKKYTGALTFLATLFAIISISVYYWVKQSSTEGNEHVGLFYSNNYNI